MSKSKKNRNRVARRHPDPHNPSTTVVEYEPAPESQVHKKVTFCEKCGKPFSNRAGTLCSSCENAEQEAKDVAARKAAEAHHKKMEGALHLNCTTCGKPFYITKAKQEKLKSLGKPMYTECYACQQAHNDEAAKAAASKGAE